MKSENSKEYQNMINDLDVGFYKGEFKGKLLMHNFALNKIIGIDPSKKYYIVFKYNETNHRWYVEFEEIKE